MQERGEDWIAEGLPHGQTDTCPYCGQSTRSIELIEAYKAFFNEGYRQLRSDLARYRENAARLFADDKIELARSRLPSNADGAELWARYVALAAPTPLDAGRLADALTSFRSEALALLDRKQASPLDAVALPETYVIARDNLGAILQEAAAYNGKIAAANAAIEAFKKSANPAQNELGRLRLIKRRYEPTVKPACDSFIALTQEKEALEIQKQGFRDKLDEYSKAVTERYSKAVNGYLRRFTAGFRIDRELSGLRSYAHLLFSR